MFGHWTPLQLTDLPVAVLFILALSLDRASTASCSRAGRRARPTRCWAGVRSTAQVISYEVAMGLSFAAVFLYAGTMSTSQIVAAQDRRWYVFLLLPSFVIYAVSMVGETNRAPFDLPEAEGELVGGFHTEYSSLKFAMFYPRRVRQHGHGVGAGRPRCSSAAGTRRGRSTCGPGPTPAGGRCCGSSARCASSCSSSSGCAARCRGCATTSS